jgi:hypothetical protein
VARVTTRRRCSTHLAPSGRFNPEYLAALRA